MCVTYDPHKQFSLFQKFQGNKNPEMKISLKTTSGEGKTWMLLLGVDQETLNKGQWNSMPSLYQVGLQWHCNKVMTVLKTWVKTSNLKSNKKKVEILKFPFLCLFVSQNFIAKDHVLYMHLF